METADKSGDVVRNLLLLLALALTGCASGYGKSNIFGGYWSKDGPGELVEVGFNGNGYTDIRKVEIYVLFRSAEIAKQRGKAHFSIYQNLANAIVDRPLSEETQASAIGGKPYAKVFMLMHDAPVTGSLVADDILAKYDAQVKGNQAIDAAGAKQ